MYTMIVNQDSLHLEICLFEILLMLKLDKSILQTIASSLVSDDFAG